MQAMKSLTEILYQVSVYSVLVPLIAGLVIFKKLDMNSRTILLLLLFASIPQLVSFHPVKEVRDTCFNIYNIIDAIIWGYLFFRNSKNNVIRKSIAIIISLQVMTSVLILIKAGIQTRFYTEFVCLSSLLQVLWVLSFFYERYKREEIQALEEEPMFWFCLGILIYAPATYFRFAFYQSMRDTDYGLKSLHHLLNTGMYLIFTVGILANVIRISKFRNVFIRNQS